MNPLPPFVILKKWNRSLLTATNLSGGGTPGSARFSVTMPVPLTVGRPTEGIGIPVLSEIARSISFPGPALNTVTRVLMTRGKSQIDLPRSSSNPPDATWLALGHAAAPFRYSCSSVAWQTAGTEKSYRAPGSSRKMSSVIVWGFSPGRSPSHADLRNTPDGVFGWVVVNVST